MSIQPKKKNKSSSSRTKKLRITRKRNRKDSSNRSGGIKGKKNLKRSNAVKKTNKTGSTQNRTERPLTKSDTKQPLANTKTKYDLGKGRSLHAVQDADGKVRYYPSKNDATDAEISKGLFVKLPKKEGKKMETDSKLKTKFDLGKGRTLYPVKDGDGNIQYLPGKKEATDAEKANGLFVQTPKQEGKQVDAEAKGKTKYDLGKGRKLYPVKDADGKVRYYPDKDDATDQEKIRGLFVKIPEEKGKEITAIDPKRPNTISVRAGGCIL